MREGWEYKKLGEVCMKITDGSHNPPKGIEHSEYKMISSQNIFDDEIRINSDNVRFLTEKDFVIEDKRTSLCAGMVLLTIVGTIGRACVISGNEGKIVLQRSVAALSAKDKVLPRYLMYCLIGKRDELNIESHGIAQKGIYLKQLSSLQIPLPPLTIQQSIVAELDEINNLLSLKRKELETYDKLAQSLFYEMFGDPVENEKGWEVNKLGDNVHEMFLGPFGSALKVDSYVPASEAYAMVYEQKHAIQATLFLENHFINEEKYRTLERFEVKGGDFIMSCRGTIGKIYRVPLGSPRGIIHPSLMKIRIKENVYDPMFFRFMLEKVVKNQTTKGNCVQMAITAKELGNKLFPLPPLSLQQLFATRIEAIEEQKANVKTTIEKLETLLAARMQYWFD